MRRGAKRARSEKTRRGARLRVASDCCFASFARRFSSASLFGDIVPIGPGLLDLSGVFALGPLPAGVLLSSPRTPMVDLPARRRGLAR